MPLSPNVQRIADALRLDADEAKKAGVAAFVVPADATDEQAIALSADRLDKAAGVIEDQSERIVALSADVDRLTTDLTAAKAEATAKANEVLVLSAEKPQPMDAYNASMFRRNVNQAKETALSLGVPPELVKEVEGRLYKADKAPTVFALSADGPDAEPAAFWIFDTLGKLAKGDWGKGVMTGAAKGKAVLQASAEGDEKQLTPAEAAMAAATATIKNTYPSASVK